jgi:small subunit ribosomal protein S17
MAEKKAAPKKKKTEEAPVEETVAEATETTEAVTPAVDEGEPMASTEAMDDAAAAEAPAEEAAPVEEPVAEAEPEPEPVVEEPAAEAEPEPAVEEPAAEAEPVAEEAPVEEPVAEEPAEEEPAAEAEAPAEPAAPAPQSGPKPKRKHLPRALRPSTKKGRVKREKPAERKPIVRIPKPESEFGRRQERLGTVVSDKGDKTIVVKVDTIKAHRRYKKVVRQSKRFHAHDEQNAAKIGDIVKIIETRPLSKTKNWRLAEIVEVAQ